MTWDLPVKVDIDGKEYAIRNNCDYRVVLDTIVALNDEELPPINRLDCALTIFYEDLTGCTNIERAIKAMYEIIACGETDEKSQPQPRIMDWEHDFKLLAPPISRVLGYDVRTPNRYCHFWTFIGAYMEIGECSFSTVLSIRNKRIKGKKLEKWEQEFLHNNRAMVELPSKLTAEEEEFLYSDV